MGFLDKIFGKSSGPAGPPDEARAERGEGREEARAAFEKRLRELI